MSLGLAALGGCGSDKSQGQGSSSGRSRSDAVQAQRTGDAANTGRSEGVHPAASTPAPAPSAPSEPRVLCQDAPAAKGAPLPKVELAAITASHSAAAVAPLTVGGGKFTWLNFWAGWCEPCKEEMPLLQRLAATHGNLRVRFLSLDDDERQAQKFLDEAGAQGPGHTLWLKDSASRKALFAPLQITSLPTLPFHLIFDPSGKLLCRIDGAIDEADLPQIEQLLGASR